MDQEVEIPQFLVEQIRKGKVVLFLGAGVSVGSKNELDESPPMGGRLAMLLSQECSIEYDPAEDDLATVASNAKRMLGDKVYWNFLQRHYQHCRPSEQLVALAKYPWHRIYTLNIDDALERAYDSSDYKTQVFVNAAPVQVRPSDLSKVQIIHLNGMIDRQESGIIFTPDEYMERRSNVADWYEQSGRDLLEYTFLFVGTKLNEPLFLHHVDRLIKAQGQKPGRSYIVCPSFSVNKKAQLDNHQNIECIQCDAVGLVAAIGKSLGAKITSSQLMNARSPALKKLVNRLGSDRAMQLSGDLEALEVVDSEELRRSIAPAGPGLRQFYYGTSPTWRDIIDSVPAELTIFDGIVKAVRSGGNNRILVHGPAGSGKTTGMMWAALKVAEQDFEKLVLWFDGENSFPAKAVQEISCLMKGELIVFIDNLGMHASDVKACLEKSSSETIYVMSDRTNQVPRDGSTVEIGFDKRIKFSVISDVDVDEIIKKIEQFGPWDRLGRMSPRSRREALNVVAEKQLLVGLREATAGIGYDKIVASEFAKLKEGYAKSAYILLAVATMHRLTMTHATFDMAVKRLMNGLNPDGRRLVGLEDVAFEDGGRMRVRHQVLADFTVRRAVPKAAVLEAVDAIFFAFSRFASPLRNYAEKPEFRLFAAITNHDFLWGMFRADRNVVIEMFAKWERSFSNDALFWLQYALFEEKCGPGHLESAVNHIRTANRIYPDSYQVVNAYANIHFALALAEREPDKALLLMEQATETVGGQIRSTTSGAYAAVALYYGRIKVMKKHFPERIRSELKVAEERLREAFSREKDNSRIQKALNDLNLEAVA